MHLSAGDKLGPYEILAPLGSGGMGEVWKARDPRLNRVVAIKRLKGARRGRFSREAQAIAALNHHHICQIYDIGPDYLVMEYVEGKPLSGPLSVADAVKLALEIVSALEEAHGKGILHRDLKPANILVTTKGSVKLLDFGLAKLMKELNADATQTVEGTVVGSPAYMAPEQAEGKPLDARSDIFSFGSVFYEMLSGKRAFPGSSTAQAFSAVLRDEPPPLPLPVEIQEIVRKCLAKRPEDRFTNVAELRLALERSASPSATVSRPPYQSSIEGFRVAVLPFKFTGAGADLSGLAEGLTEEIVAGLSRFKHLSVLSGGSAGARYVIEGGLRQAGAQLRVAVQLVDAKTGARLWAETYNTTYSPDAIFEIQDSLVPPIVSTVAEWNGVLAHSMWMALRDCDPRALTPDEAFLRASGFSEHLTPEEYSLALAVLNAALEQEPNHSSCLAMLALVHTYGCLFGFGAAEKFQELSLSYARRAVASDASDHKALYALALAHIGRKEIPAFRNAADRALALNPMDGNIMAQIGMWTTYLGDWERGCELVQRAMKLNPRHPGWYWFPLAHNAYRENDYSLALDYALRLNLPGMFLTHELLARVHAQLGNRDEAAQALRDLLALRPDFAANARQGLEKWFFEASYVDHALDGLRKAGLKLPDKKPDKVAEPKAPSGPPPAPSIAVLPFANLSAEKEQEYFSDGLAEEILNLLAKIPGLKVIARTSSFSFRGKDQDIRKIAETLGVGVVLEGSVRRLGNRLRVTTQLIHAADGAHLWSERYDREFTDVFAVQDEIAEAIAAQLKLKITPASRPRRQPNLQAYEAYLRYREHQWAFTAESLRRSRECLEQAIALDPDFALPYVGLADHYFASTTLGGGRELIPRARKLAQRALELEPDLPEAHGMLGVLAGFCEGNWKEAERRFCEAISREPIPWHVRSWYFHFYLSPLGRYQEARREAELALADNPLSQMMCWCFGNVLEGQGLEAEAEAAYRKAADIDPHFWLGSWSLGVHHFVSDRWAEARAYIERAAVISPHAPYNIGALAAVLQKTGETARSESLLEQVRAGSEGRASALACFHLLTGDIDQAVEQAGKALEEGYPLLASVLIFPFARLLRRSQVWPGLMKRLNLPEGR